MKENVFDVLAYLFENYMNSSEEHSSDPDLIRAELLEAGFPQREVNKAFEWLVSLTDQPSIQPVSSPTYRIFSGKELAKLDTECRGLLLFLEQSGILSPTNRELVIDRIMAFHEESISLDSIKWIVLMVLSINQCNEEAAFERMEDWVYQTPYVYLH